MAKSNTKIIYEKEEDIFYLSKGRASQASIEVGDFVIDVDFKGFISAIEILNASENLGISSESLERISSASMTVSYKPNYLFIVLAIKLPERDKDIRIPLTVGLGHKKVEREETVFMK